MKPMQAGKLRKLVLIEQDTGSNVDLAGAHVPTWTTFQQTWAGIEPVNGREPMQAGQQRPDVTHKITIRWRPGMNPSMRIRYPVTNGRIFSIFSMPNTEELNREIVIMAKELVES